MKILKRVFLLASISVCLNAQTIDDGIMMTKHSLFTGFMYSHDSWDQYWEGSLKRVNGNIDVITTQTNTAFANYGLTNRLNVIANVPYVWTEASKGVLHGMGGFQDITFAAKYSFFEKQITELLALKAIAVGSGAIPLTDYTPDFLPLSIGSASKRLSGRFTLNLQSKPGWYFNGSTSYVWRSGLTLDRPYYYTDGHLYLTDQVDMPNVFDYIVSAGYTKRGLLAEFNISEQRTQGGGDIRRQDAPFVSNRMNFARAGGRVMCPLPKFRNMAFQFSYAYVIDGRNVGQSTTFTTALMYRFKLFGRQTQ